MRASELGRLRWKHVDFSQRVIYIYKQKNKKEGTIPLHRKAEAVLNEIGEEAPGEYVFSSPRDSSHGPDGPHRSIRAFREQVSKAFLQARRDAGIDRPISFHSLRHGFCTMLAKAGKPAYVIKAAARHASIQTSMIYVNLSNDHVRTEVEDAFEEEHPHNG